MKLVLWQSQEPKIENEQLKTSKTIMILSNVNIGENK